MNINYSNVKKSIRIAFPTFTSPNNIRLILEMLEPEFHVIIDKTDYDYYFVDDIVYYNSINMQEVLHAKKDAIKIMVAYEAIFPDLNIFDYAISFINELNCEDRIFHLPYIEMLNKIGYKDVLSSIDAAIDTMNVVCKKNKFCNFIYGNGNGHWMREKLFWEISKYKKVDSLGSFLNNVSVRNSRNDKNWLEKSIELKSPYKFSIAAENTLFPGYTSEKLITSMLAGTIPIYWGNPYVANEYNKKALIIITEYESLDKAVDKIKYLDENEMAYFDMLSEPWRTDEQIQKFHENVEKFYNSFYGIFKIKKEDAYRRPEGCWPDVMYPIFFTTQNTNGNANFFNRIRDKIGRRFRV